MALEIVGGVTRTKITAGRISGRAFPRRGSIEAEHETTKQASPYP